MKCPGCGGNLKRVPNSNWLNEDQYASCKAGDWFCEICPDNGRGQSGLCYWWSAEVESFQAAQCAAISRC
jgi:hypothetical protein